MTTHLLRHSVSFLCGTLVTTLAMFWAGGGSRSGLLVGAGVSVLAALVWARTVARLLNALAEATDRFRGVWRNPASRTEAEKLTPVQQDVVSALTHQGVQFRQARRKVLSVGACEDFEELFRKAVAA